MHMFFWPSNRTYQQTLDAMHGLVRSLQVTKIWPFLITFTYLYLELRSNSTRVCTAGRSMEIYAYDFVLFTLRYCVNCFFFHVRLVVKLHRWTWFVLNIIFTFLIWNRYLMAGTKENTFFSEVFVFAFSSTDH